MGYKIPDKQAAAWGPVINTQGARRRLRAERRNRGVQVYPGITSDSADFLRFTRGLAVELSDTYTPSINHDGTLGSDGVPGDFYQLLTVSGYGMNPISVPPVSNSKIRADLGLATEFINTRDQAIFTELVKLMFARSRPSSVSIRREASTGAPDYVNAVEKKKSELRAALGNAERFLTLIDRGQLRDLYVEFNSPIVHTTGERTQPDRVIRSQDGVFASKDREVNDEIAARTALAEGRRFPADKRVFKDGTEITGHFAGRRRTVFGTSFVPNYFLATFCSSWRAVYLEEYAFTWKHRTTESILAKISRYQHLVGFDVKQFDQTVASFLIERMITDMAAYVDKRVVKLIRLLFSAPYIVPYPWIAGTSDADFNPLFGDDPLDEASFKMELGLPSGISINPDTGKLMMVFQYLVLLDRYFGNVMEIGIDTILKGEHDQYAMLNMGDDCVLLTNDDGFHRWALEGDRPGVESCKYFALEEEKPISFLGNVPYRDDRGDVRLAPNVISYLVNWLTPEFGVEHRKRMNFWAIGERERRMHYMVAPAYQHVHTTFERHFSGVFGTLPSSITAEAYEKQRRYQNLSTWDALVLQNPDYLHYKVDETQVSPEIMDIIVTSLPPEETWPIVSRYTDARFQQPY